MVLPAFVCGGVAVCVCAPLCVLCDKKQAPRLRAAPRELSLRSQIPSPLSSLPGARLLARLASGKGGRRTKAGGEKGGSKKKTQHGAQKVPRCACSLRCAPRGRGHPEPPPAGGPLHPLGGDGCLQGGVRSKALSLHISMSLFCEGVVFLLRFFPVFNPRIICTKPFVEWRCLLCTCESNKSEVVFPAAPSPIRAALLCSRTPNPFLGLISSPFSPSLLGVAAASPICSALCARSQGPATGRRHSHRRPRLTAALLHFLWGCSGGFLWGFSHINVTWASPKPRRGVQDVGERSCPAAGAGCGWCPAEGLAWEMRAGSGCCSENLLSRLGARPGCCRSSVWLLLPD